MKCIYFTKALFSAQEIRY